MENEQKTIRDFNVYQKVALARKDFMGFNVTKSGTNGRFNYFELSDIVPYATALCVKYGLLFTISFNDVCALGRVINVDNPSEFIDFTSPAAKLDNPTKAMNSIQALGAAQTYQRRYLYYLFLDIVEHDWFDINDGSDKGIIDPPAAVKRQQIENKKASSTTQDRQEIVENLTNQDVLASELQIQALGKAIEKLASVSHEKNLDCSKIIKQCTDYFEQEKTSKRANEMIEFLSQRIKEAEAVEVK